MSPRSTRSRRSALTCRYPVCSGHPFASCWCPLMMHESTEGAVKIPLWEVDLSVPWRDVAVGQEESGSLVPHHGPAWTREMYRPYNMPSSGLLPGISGHGAATWWTPFTVCSQRSSTPLRRLYTRVHIVEMPVHSVSWQPSLWASQRSGMGGETASPGDGRQPAAPRGARQQHCSRSPPEVGLPLGGGPATCGCQPSTRSASPSRLYSVTAQHLRRASHVGSCCTSQGKRPLAHALVSLRSSPVLG